MAIQQHAAAAEEAATQQDTAVAQTAELQGLASELEELDTEDVQAPGRLEEQSDSANL